MTLVEGGQPFGWSEQVQAAVRERTPDEFWESAAQHVMARADWIGISPLGDFVNILVAEVDPDGLLFPDDVRQRIEDDAFEAARETILDGINEHLRQLAGAIRDVR
ncbi:MAG TPA: hypothetical protein VHD87_14865 [Acidimicrobiales bacterium]|nr:hypothetical protein [Acidimicrobiales bacterium]